MTQKNKKSQKTKHAEKTTKQKAAKSTSAKQKSKNQDNQKLGIVVEATIKDVIKVKAPGKPEKVSNLTDTNATQTPISTMTIGQLEEKMLKKFPAETACEWDRTGLLVGDKSNPINRVAVALDPTVEAVKIAKNANANLLVTHHPSFMWKINNFHPADSVAQADGALVYEAISLGVALMNFHTALDVSREGASVLPGLLNLKIQSVFDPTDGLSQEKSQLGFGRICTLKQSEKNLTNRDLGARCTSVFRKSPKIYGDLGAKPEKIVTTTGSTGGLEPGSLLNRAIKEKIDCIICGEIRYHDALAVSQAGVCVIELGHDISELPLVAPLVAAITECGVSKSQIMLIDQSNNWNYIDSTRV